MKKYIIKGTPVSVVLLFLAGLFFGTLFQSCDDDDKDKDAIPEIHYIRITDPDKSDSLIVRAYLGSTIALVGDNLQDVVEVWFNDQSAKLIINYITQKSIIVTIPSGIPEVVTNELRLVTKYGKEAVSEFFVVVPPPLVRQMLCEFVDDGDIAVIMGNYFIDDENSPLEVFFPGNLPGEVVNVALNQIRVRVPQGAGVGPVTVKSIYGSTRSSFFFRDDRGMILDWDVLNASGGWRSGVIRNNDPVAGIAGNYVLFQGALTADAGETWNEDGFSFNLWGTANGRPSGDLFSIPVSNALLKFEINVSQEWSSHALQMIFTPWGTSGTNGYIADGTTPRGLWYPWRATGSFKTDGWITVAFPLSRFVYDHAGNEIVSSPRGEGNWGGLTFFVYHGGVNGKDSNPVIAIDNIRVVPAQ